MSSRPVVLRTACIKTLSAVEAHPTRSNQHEFNGVLGLKSVLGTAEFPSRPAIFSIRGQAGTVTANVTWYDARDRHPTRSEYRLYFQTNPVMAQAQEGDNIAVGYAADGTLQIILIKSGSADHVSAIQNWQPTTI